MKLTCPDCNTTIEDKNINIATDRAKCMACNKLFKASQLLRSIDTKPPSGSLIVFNDENKNDMFFVIPKRGIEKGDTFPLIFSSFWIAFIAFWTWGASQGSVIFAAFSIPFWVTGFIMWKGIIVNITQQQAIVIQPDTLTIIKKSPISSQKIVIPYSEIDSIELTSTIATNPITMPRHIGYSSHMPQNPQGILLPTITHGIQKTHFAENVSEPEMEWLVEVLNQLLVNKI